MIRSVRCHCQFPLRCVIVTCDTTNCQHPTSGHTSSGPLPVPDTEEMSSRLLSYGCEVMTGAFMGVLSCLVFTFSIRFSVFTVS